MTARSVPASVLFILFALHPYRPRAAPDAVLAGEEVNPQQKPSMGCNI